MSWIDDFIRGLLMIGVRVMAHVRAMHNVEIARTIVAVTVSAILLGIAWRLAWNHNRRRGER
jgi:hypothetical protein